MRAKLMEHLTLYFIGDGRPFFRWVCTAEMPREAMESVMHAEFCAINCQDCMQSAKGILDSICSKWLLVAVRTLFP